MRGRDAGDGWYVIQIATGHEQQMCELIRRVAPGEVLDECFTPGFETQKKFHGEWRRVVQVLFPGYLVAVSRDVEGLERCLREVPEFTRLLSQGEAFVPLEEGDRAWLGAMTERESRVVPMSMGVYEGDRVVVFKGPLMGREGLITSVNRHKSLAWLELEMFGRKIRTRVGLGIVRGKRTE